MNQKDYKEIARIIKEENRSIVSPEMEVMRRVLVERLADYFERENNEFKQIDYKCPADKFNKKQFLKGCGIEKLNDDKKNNL